MLHPHIFHFTLTPAYLLAGVLKEAGVPDGVCNLVFGFGNSVGTPLVTHPHVPIISFTGGTVTGKRCVWCVLPNTMAVSMFYHIFMTA